LDRNFQHDRGNVPPCEKVFAILKGFGGKLFFVVQSVSKDTERRSVAGKQVWRHTGKGPDTGFCHRDLPGASSNQKLAIRTT
jgi:hypothetical protein